ANSSGLVYYCLALFIAELCRTGRIVVAQSRSAGQSFLYAAARMGFIPDDWTGHGCSGHCLAGGDYRGIFDGQSGHSTALFAASIGQAYLGSRTWPDLSALY